MGSYLKAETSFRKRVSEGFSERQPKMLKTISAQQLIQKERVKKFISSSNFL
jgi:hypothetical protein